MRIKNNDNEAAQAELLTCICEARHSNFGWDTDYPDQGYFSVPPGKCWGTTL